MVGRTEPYFIPLALICVCSVLCGGYWASEYTMLICYRIVEQSSEPADLCEIKN